MPRKKKETLVHLDLETISQEITQGNSTLKMSDGRISIGSTLKNAREKQKLSLTEISQKLCIKEIFLEALERGHYYVFPGLSYGTGFLRTYALFLGLDAKQLVFEFHQETSEIQTESTQMPIPKNSNLMPSFRMILNAFLLLLIIYLIWYIFMNFPKSGTLETNELEIITEVLSPEKEGEQQLNEQGNFEEEPLAEAMILETPSDDSVSLSVSPKIPANIQIKTPETISAVKSANKIYGSEDSKGFGLVAKNEVWVRIMDDDRVVFERVLYPQDRYNVLENMKNLRIRTANAGALTVYIGDKEIRPLGEKGKFLSGALLNIDNFR